MNHWSLPADSVVFCVRDNAANMRAAVRGTDWYDLPCFAHTLQLVIRDAINEVEGMSNMIKNAKSLVGHYCHSQVALNRLSKTCSDNNIHYLEPIQSVVTRWNSEFLMIERLLHLREAVTIELTLSGRADLLLTANEWKLAEGLRTILSPYYESTKELSGENYSTRSMIIPWIFNLYSNTENFIQNRNSTMAFGLTFARALLKNMNVRFSDYKCKFPDNVATYVDPRYWCVLFNDNELQEIHESIKKFWGKFFTTDHDNTEPEQSVTEGDLSIQIVELGLCSIKSAKKLIPVALLHLHQKKAWKKRLHLIKLFLQFHAGPNLTLFFNGGGIMQHNFRNFLN
jgi:hypothetical protein